MAGELEGRTAIVTGAASGIGAAAARRLAAAGAQVFLFDRDAAGAEAVADELDTATAYAVDVADAASVATAVAAVVGDGEALDILVNCAGIGTSNMLANMSLDDWRRVIDINLSGPFYCLKASLPALKVRGGSVINIASIAGKRISYHGGVNYTASKAGLLGLTRHAAFELARDGIRVNAICPGPVLTPMVQAVSTDAQIDQAAETIPLGRWAQPDDIADMILFLAGPASAMCTGASFDVDGGVLVSNGVPYQEYIARRTQAEG